MSTEKPQNILAKYALVTKLEAFERIEQFCLFRYGVFIE